MSTFHPLYPSTRILTTRPLPHPEATTFLQTFLHWTSSTRPIRNRKHPYNSLPVVPFPHSVLNNLRRIEMGLRGERAPRIKPKKDIARKRKWARDDDGALETVAVEEEEDVEEEYGEVDKEAEKEIQMGGREMRGDGEVVDGAPTVLAIHEEGGAAEGVNKKRKEERKKDKKTRRKGEKKVREEKRRKGE
ncbi:hypothetical protein BGX38DRAFT_1271843 [Terfezia claveryi]|nr:hypothetical protein BGX38DRAFT_1271843 [Terfezia claveryi]